MSTQTENQIKKVYPNTISINEIIRKCTSHWFNEDSKRFFKSLWDQYAIQNDGSIFAYFISSEKHNDEARKYTVRRFNLISGNVSSPYPEENTIFEFQKYDTKKQADKALREYIKTEPQETDKQEFYKAEIANLEYQLKTINQKIAEYTAQLK